MFYCNKSTTELIIQGLKTISYIAGGSYIAHNELSISFIPPDDIANIYYIYSLTGRSYGTYSDSQFYAVDA